MYLQGSGTFLFMLASFQWHLFGLSGSIMFFPSPGMQWSVVAKGRVSETPHQLLLWWLLSPETCRPLGQCLRRHPSFGERARSSLQYTRLHWHLFTKLLPLEHPPIPTNLSSGISADVILGVKGHDSIVYLLGVFVLGSPRKGYFSSLSTSSPGISPLLHAVIPSTFPYLPDLSHLFQTLSLTVSYLSHKCLQICLFCCAWSHTLSKHILPAPISVWVLFQKHTFMFCSHLSWPHSNCVPILLGTSYQCVPCISGSKLVFYCLIPYL